MFFSPVAERSFKVRALYLSFYGFLALGAITMVIPFVIMLSGSAEPGVRFTNAQFFPAYLVSDGALWDRYVEAKYRNENVLLRMAWGDGRLDLNGVSVPQSNASDAQLWSQFLTENDLPETLFATGFCATARRVPYYYNRAFRNWLAGRFGTIKELNQALGTTFRTFQAIEPPNLSLTGGSLNRTPLVQHFLEFCRDQVPASRKFVWDAGGYYRNVFLPRLIGEDIAVFNAQFGTHYASYTDVPFTDTVPTVAAEPWVTFVTKMIRPDFVELTPSGAARIAGAGLARAEFIRTAAKPEDLRVATADRLYAQWAKSRHGMEDARIPQPVLDAAAFQNEKGFWRWIFLTQNYQFVLDEILLHGRAMGNTVLLVILKVLGALLVNPMAAYALSRFKLRKTYLILLLFLVTIAFPAEVTMIPVFLQLREFSMLNTFWALVLPGLANGFSIFLLKGFFDSLPRELYEAAELDGAGEWRMFWMITMSLSKPILAVIALSAFVSAYGAFFYALIVCPDPKMWTIMVYVYQLQNTAPAPVVYASLIITAIPTLLVFIFCQNLILRGIVVPSEK